MFPIGAGIVLSALYFRIDLLLVETWHGTEPVALYNAAFRLVETVRLFPAAVLAVALPSLCRATDTRPLRRVGAAVTAFGIVAAPVLWVAANWGVPFIYRHIVRGRGAGVPHSDSVAAADVAEFCAHASADWLGRPARVRHCLRRGARREHGAQRDNDSSTVNRRCGMGDGLDGTRSDRRLRDRPLARGAARGGRIVVAGVVTRRTGRTRLRATLRDKISS